MLKFSHDGLIKLAIYALAFLWIFTGLTSILFSPDVGFEILAEADIIGVAADIAVYSGGLIDIAIGLWLLWGKCIKQCCAVQMVIILSYTVLLTIIDASFWLHPFGPLTKNLPIVVLILLIWHNEAADCS